MNDFYCAGNWKMNLSVEGAAQFVRQLRSEAPNGKDLRTHLVLFPPALLAWKVAEGLQGSSIQWGGQNCYAQEQGAFTGENSPRTLLEMGAKYALVGHSERRQIFGEGEELIAQKVAALQSIGLIPVLCIGETLDDRRWNRTREVVLRQLRTALKNADPK
jgi:triosephosphate isomerase